MNKLGQLTYNSFLDSSICVNFNTEREKYTIIAAIEMPIAGSLEFVWYDSYRKLENGYFAYDIISKVNLSKTYSEDSEKPRYVWLNQISHDDELSTLNIKLYKKEDKYYLICKGINSNITALSIKNLYTERPIMFTFLNLFVDTIDDYNIPAEVKVFTVNNTVIKNIKRESAITNSVIPGYYNIWSKEGLLHIGDYEINYSIPLWLLKSDDKFIGSTSERPSSPPLGFSFYDTSLGKPIWWNGSSWTDANGATV
jgi:hypothetical protein